MGKIVTVDGVPHSIRYWATVGRETFHGGYAEGNIIGHDPWLSKCTNGYPRVLTAALESSGVWKTRNQRYMGGYGRQSAAAGTYESVMGTHGPVSEKSPGCPRLAFFALENLLPGYCI